MAEWLFDMFLGDRLIQLVGAIQAALWSSDSEAGGGAISRVNGLGRFDDAAAVGGGNKIDV